MARCRRCSPPPPCWRCSGWCCRSSIGWTPPALSERCGRAFPTGRDRADPMTSGVIADSIVNWCGAIGLAVAMMTFYRRDPKSPLTRRLLLALGVIALLFLMRGAAWWTGSASLDRLSVVPAALIPLGALIVTEGILRRHAPRTVKMAALFGGILLGLGGALGVARSATPYAVALSLFQLSGFAACAGLLAARDPPTLMASENRSISRLAGVALVVVPFIPTEFRTPFPDI